MKTKNNHVYQCPYCGNKYEQKGMSNHLARTHKIPKGLISEFILKSYLGKDVFDEMVKSYSSGEENVSTLSNKYNIFIQTLIDYFIFLKIYRTRKEEMQTVGYKKRIAAGCIASMGVDNPSKSDAVKLKKEKIFIEKYGFKSNILTPEIKKKREESLENITKEELKARYVKTSSSLIKKYGVENPAQIPSCKEKNTKFHKDRWSKFSLDERRQMTVVARDGMQNKSGSWTSKIEKRVEEILISINVKFDKHTFIDGYNFDFQIGNILIEVNGDYWHANPRIYKADDMLASEWKVSSVWEKDERKKLAAQKLGYSVIYLWEMDINSQTDEKLRETIITSIAKESNENRKSD